jgi:hypothetical protein
VEERTSVWRFNRMSYFADLSFSIYSMLWFLVAICINKTILLSSQYPVAIQRRKQSLTESRFLNFAKLLPWPSVHFWCSSAMDCELLWPSMAICAFHMTCFPVPNEYMQVSGDVLTMSVSVPQKAKPLANEAREHTGLTIWWIQQGAEKWLRWANLTNDGNRPVAFQ